MKKSSAQFVILMMVSLLMACAKDESAATSATPAPELQVPIEAPEIPSTPSVPAACVNTPGDANNNGVVGDGGDYTILYDNWGQTVTGGNSEGDFNGDGLVDGGDMTILMDNDGETGPVCP